MNLDHPALVTYQPLVKIPPLESQLQFHIALESMGADQLRVLLKNLYSDNIQAAEIINKIGRENAALKLNYIDRLNDSKQYPMAT